MPYVAKYAIIPGMKTAGNALGAACAFLLPLAVAADTLHLTANDASGQSSFTVWNAGGGGTESPSSANDYVCAGYTIRAPGSYDAKFPGKSLTLGDFSDNRNGVIVGYNRNTQKMTFENDGLFLSQGRLTSWSSGKEYTYAGTITVLSPAEYPAFFQISDTPSHMGCTNIITATMKGGAGTAFAIINSAENPTGYARLSPSVSSTFEGTAIIGAVSNDRFWAEHPVRCELMGARTWPGGIDVRAGSALLAQYGGTKWSVKSLSLASGSTLFTKIAGADTSTITVRESLSTKFPVRLTTPGLSAGSTASDSSWTVLTLPVGKGEIRSGDFVTESSIPAGLPHLYTRVAVSGGIQSLELVRRQVVRLTDNAPMALAVGADGFYTATTNASAWSDLALPHGADYVVDSSGYNLNIAPAGLLGDDMAYEFPGASLTLGSASGDVNLYSAADTTRIAVLRLGNNARYWPKCHLGGAGTVVVDGDAIHCLATGGGTAYLRIFGDRTYVVKAPLTGAGRLTVFNNASSSKPDATVVFSGVSTNFHGRIRMSAGEKDGYTVPNTLLVEDGRGLGGDLDEFTFDALELRAGSLVMVTNDVSFTARNRGLYVGDSGFMDVAEGATFEVGGTVSFGDGAALTKTGGGVLALGGGTRLAEGASSASFAVSEGFIQPMATNALGGAALSFGAEAALLVDVRQTGALAERGVVDLSESPFGGVGTLPVALKFPDGEEIHEYSGVAICTISADAVRHLAVRPQKVRRHEIVVSARDNEDGTVTILAGTRRGGLRVFVR